jgi:hypothetical protein
MKKFAVLFSLFVLPLVFYIFLSKGIYKYSNLPILTEKVIDVSEYSSQNQVTFTNKLSIVCFLGKDIKTAKASLFNLNQTIYKRYYQKPFFQAIAILPEISETDYKEVIKELSAFTDISQWKFVYSDATSIEALFESFNTPYELNLELFSQYAFIIDMEHRLRGRKDDEDTANGKLYGYNMRSVAVLKNKMKDDIDIIYYQLKKSAEKNARRKREI